MRWVVFLVCCSIRAFAMTLQEAEQMALANNTEVKAAEELFGDGASGEDGGDFSVAS